MKKKISSDLLIFCLGFLACSMRLSAQRPSDYYVYMLSSNQDTENIVVLRIDRVTGRLTPTGVQIPLANPGSVAFVRK